MGNGPPGIVIWFKVYAASISVCNIALAILGIWLMTAIDPFIPLLTEDQLAAVSLRVVGIVLCAAGLVFMSLPIVSVFTTDQSWAWAYNLGMLLFGFVFTFITCCFPILLVSLPLFAGWFNKDVLDYYGISQSPRRRKKAPEPDLTPPP